jgi:hypothetical protein
MVPMTNFLPPSPSLGMEKVAARYWKIENNEDLKKKGT